MIDRYFYINKSKYDSEAASMTDLVRRAAFKNAYKEILKILPVEKPLSVLDVGCGTGNLADALAENVEAYVGIDISPNALQIAKSRSLKNSKFVEVDLLDFEVGVRKFDVVACMSSIDQIYYKDRSLEKIKYLLKANGLLILEVRNANYIIKKWLRWAVPSLQRVNIVSKYPHGQIIDLTFDQWIDLVRRNGFEIVQIRRAYRPAYATRKIEKIKVMLHRLISLYLPIKHHNMICLILKLP